MRSIRAGMRSLGALSLATLLLAAGCGGGDDSATTVTVRETVTETGTGTVAEREPVSLSLYFLRDGKVWPEERSFVPRPAIATVAMHQLFEGPATGLDTAIPPEIRLERLVISDGVASINFRPTLTRAALAQIVYTLTQFPTVKRVALDGGSPVGRAAFEQQTPAILVESPLAGETVESGFKVTGTANTFEATFQYELKDSAGKVLSKNFVTATSGSGTRGTFAFEVDYELEKRTEGSLVVFEISAADGSRTNEHVIPLTLQ
jgi:hypothetical protein